MLKYKLNNWYNLIIKSHFPKGGKFYPEGGKFYPEGGKFYPEGGKFLPEGGKFSEHEKKQPIFYIDCLGM